MPWGRADRYADPNNDTAVGNRGLEVQDHHLLGTHSDAAHPDGRRQRPNVGLALARKQLTERPGSTKTREVGGAQVLERGVEISKVQDMTAPGKPMVSYAYFNDPDGHGWALQKLPY
jgi:catechol 2,3-dioxygenase-like lactoylglutathione lyase family enzyme